MVFNIAQNKENATGLLEEKYLPEKNQSKIWKSHTIFKSDNLNIQKSLVMFFPWKGLFSGGNKSQTIKLTARQGGNRMTIKLSSTILLEGGYA